MICSYCDSVILLPDLDREPIKEEHPVLDWMRDVIREHRERTLAEKELRRQWRERERLEEKYEQERLRRKERQAVLDRERERKKQAREAFRKCMLGVSVMFLVIGFLEVFIGLLAGGDGVLWIPCLIGAVMIGVSCFMIAAFVGE